MKFARITQSAFAAGLATIALFFGPMQCPAQYIPLSGPGSAYSVPQAQLIQTEALNLLLQAKTPDKPLMLQVGSLFLFNQAHIPGSVYIGAAAQPDGLQQLENTAAKLSRKKFIVLYCGCCPWNHCPNVGPAYNQLHSMGFTNVKVLYLPNNLGDDWVAKGYPIERGH
jgi:3-mercaptopyruvate sulfurtransferase SseA